MRLELNEKEVSYLPCSALMAIKELEQRTGCSLREARDAVFMHPNYVATLCDATCALCGAPVSTKCDTQCSECGNPL